MAETKKKTQGIAQYDLTGANKGETAANAFIFEKKVAPALMAQYVRVYRTNQRQGNAATKTRSEVNGTTKKVYKQKGTGKARHGSMKAPIFKGGGVVGGPKPKEYRLSLNKKQKQQALFGALTMKFSAGDVLSLDAAKEAKTKVFATFLNKLKLKGEKVLFVMSKGEESKMVLALRNLKSVTCTPAHSINAYEVLNASKVVFVGGALKELETHFLS